MSNSYKVLIQGVTINRRHSRSIVLRTADHRFQEAPHAATAGLRYAAVDVVPAVSPDSRSGLTVQALVALTVTRCQSRAALTHQHSCRL